MEKDFTEWLNDQIGVHDYWNSHIVSREMNKTMLAKIKSAFGDLQEQSKLKVLLSIFHVPPSKIKELKSELDELLHTALTDYQESVTMLVEIMEPYPSTGCLNVEGFKAPNNETSSKAFNNIAAEITNSLKNANAVNLLPLEFSYLNKNALEAIIGLQSQFSIFNSEVSKAERQRQALLQKAASATSPLLSLEFNEQIPARIKSKPIGLSEMFQRKDEA